MTDLFGAIVALFVVLVADLAVFVRIVRRLGREDSAWLVRTCHWAVGLRMAVGLIINTLFYDFPFLQMFWGDSGTYDARGHLLAAAWSSDLVGAGQVASGVSGYGFVYYVAALYSVFGRNQLLVQCLNAIIGGLAVAILYAIARDLFDQTVARWTAMMMAFFPQMIIWSSAMYKDPAVQLCIAVCMYSVLRLRRTFAARHLVFFVLAALSLMTLRFYVFYMVLFAALGTFAFTQRRGLLASVLAQATLVAVFGAAFTLGVRSETRVQQQEYFALDRLQAAREGQLQVGETDFGADIDVSSPAGALKALPVGLFYLLLAPFPWSFGSLRQMAAIPEMLVWYWLLPSLWRGLRAAFRTRLRDALPILVFALTLTLAYAVFQSNVGAVYRQRTQISMFFFIFMAAGLQIKRQRVAAQRLPPSGFSSARP